MELMTSGAFARASGLSRKALRLYDELGLLHPARVDPQTLYRFYDPGQLEQARLVAWLRRLGMPLAAIRAVSGLPSARAAEELAAYWAKVEAETAATRPASWPARRSSRRSGRWTPRCRPANC